MIYFALIASVLIGILIVFVLKPNDKWIQLFLAFSGAYLLSITLLHILPEVYHSDSKNVGIFILIGILLQLVLDFFSQGAEHGHLHVHKKHVFPWVLFISLSIHALLEGIPLAHNHAGYTHEHNNLLWAIVIHKIPVAVILSSFLLNSSFDKKKGLLFILGFSLMSPLGSFLGDSLPILNDYRNEITSIIIGIFLHISTTILFESSQNHKFNAFKFLAILVGMGIALLV